MSPKVLNLILKALDANGEAVFGRKDLAAWPRADIKEALRSGLLEKAAPANEVVCPGCEEACLEDVEFDYGVKPKDTRAFVVCGQRDDIGRVPVPLKTLDRWAVNRMQAVKVDLAANALPAVLQTPAEQQPLPNGKEVPWNPSDPDYIPAKDAVAYVKEISQNFDYGDLNKVLTRDGPMRHMRNPDKEEKGPGSVRCKVHKGDLETWCDGLRRAPTAKARPGGGKPAKPTHSGDGLYEKGFAEGHQEGYRQGYTEVKERKRYSCEPSFQDAPDDQYVHGLYEGWKAGYKEGRRDSENGNSQKHGARE
jgi:hypothetical protein